MVEPAGRRGFHRLDGSFGLAIAAALLLNCFAGCIRTTSELQYLGGPKGDYRKEIATSIDHPIGAEQEWSDSSSSLPPRRIRHPNRDELWDLTLAEVLHLSLSNATILRVNSQFLSPQNVVLANPVAAPSVYDPAIQETGVRYGGRGVEAALADFDTRFTTSMLWGRNEQVQNNAFLSGGLPPGQTLVDETGAFAATLQKRMATGGSITLRHTWDYSLANVPTRLFGSVYTGLLQAEYRHPLMAGSGTEFNRIAGPVAAGMDTITNQGVVIARIDNDISLAEFEANVLKLVRDVESAYWTLYLKYRVYDADVTARNAALESWREVNARADAGVGGGGAADEAQARESYLESSSRAQNALADVFAAEGCLRRLAGLPVNDGRIIRPNEEPIAAELLVDWPSSLTEALTYRVELRQQDWTIKKLMLQLKAAESLTQPRLDFVSQYRLNGFGNHLIGDGDDDPTGRRLGSAYGTLTRGDQTGWNLGFEFSVPVGLRHAYAQVRNFELQLAKARAVRAAQELEISHELSAALQSLDRWYVTAELNFNRRIAAEKRLKSYEAEYKAGRSNLDIVLRSQMSLAQAEISYFQALTDYNKAVVDLNYYRGTLLDSYNIHLAEACWKPDAAVGAERASRARRHAFTGRFLHSEPLEFAAGQPRPRIMPKLEFPQNGDSASEQEPAAVPSASADESLPGSLNAGVEVIDADTGGFSVIHLDGPATPTNSVRGAPVQP